MKNLLSYLIVIFFGTILMVGCEYDFIYVPPNPVSDYVDPDPDPIDPTLLSFSEKIVPIFTTGNRCTACHGDGAQRPTLTSAKAYSEINAMGLVNKADPASSKLYTYVLAGTSTHAWKKMAASQSALVLQWITEGATNN